EQPDGRDMLRRFKRVLQEQRAIDDRITLMLNNNLARASSNTKPIDAGHECKTLWAQVCVACVSLFFFSSLLYFKIFDNTISHRPNAAPGDPQETQWRN